MHGYKTALKSALTYNDKRTNESSCNKPKSNLKFHYATLMINKICSSKVTGYKLYANGDILLVKFVVLLNSYK
jgi:hypothetical protein